MAAAGSLPGPGGPSAVDLAEGASQPAAGWADPHSRRRASSGAPALSLRWARRGHRHPVNSPRLFANIGALAADVKTVKADVKTVTADVKTVKADVETIKADVETVKADVETVKADVETIKADVKTVKEGT